jgi:branched-chain amino acid transport system substrate-binding protein
MNFPRRFFVAASCAAIPFFTQSTHAAGNTQKTSPALQPKIGALFPLTGPDSLIGDEALRGVQLAMDAIDAAGGIAAQNISLIQGDALNQYQAEQAAKSLISGSAVSLLLGTGASSLAYPGSAAAELAQIPYIELNAEADGITGRNFRFLLRTCLTTSMLAATAIAAMGKRFPGKQIGLLFNTGATAGAIAAAALSQWQGQKITPLLSIGYAEDAADLHDPVGRLKRAGAEILLHAAGIDDVLVFFQAMQDTGYKPEAVIGCGDGYGLRETAFALGAPFNGTYVSAAPYYPPPAAAIAAAYQARYGMNPRSADSLTAYTGAKLVFDQLAALKGDSTKLLDTLRKTNLATGTLANGWGVQFDKTGQNSLAFATLQQWQNGGLVTLE